MTLRTPEEAAQALCPFSRVFALPQASKGCHGPSCALWRWAPIPADDPRFVAAVKKLIAEGMTHRAAVAVVSKDREAHGIPTAPERGFCGAGGAP